MGGKNVYLQILTVKERKIHMTVILPVYIKNELYMYIYIIAISDFLPISTSVMLTIQHFN